MFIVIEGIDGAGCETQAKLVFEKLKKKKQVVTGHCPVPTLLKYPNYKNPVGKMLQKFLYNGDKLDAKQQFLLYSLQFIWDAPKIQQKLKSVEISNQLKSAQTSSNRSYPISTDFNRFQPIIIADRYFTTTLCYQTLEGIEENMALQFATDFGIIKPDLAFFLNVRPEIAIKRKHGEDKIKNFREKDFSFIKKTYSKYLDLVDRQVWTKWVKIDGERKPEEVSEEIVKKIQIRRTIDSGVVTSSGSA